MRGIIGSRLINYPNDFLITTPLTELNGLTAFGREIVASRPDGIRSLQPDSPQLRAIRAQPIRQGVVYHSVIGQKNTRKPLLDSSDGTVAYWSSHLAGAASEKIVIDSHTPMVENQDTIEELRRIFYLHAGIAQPL